MLTFIADFIDKNATAGTMESYNVLGEHLKIESERLRHVHLMAASTSTNGPSTTTAKKRYTHKRAGSERHTAAAKKADAAGGAAAGSGAVMAGAGLDPRRQSLAQSGGALTPLNISTENLVKMICAM